MTPETLTPYLSALDFRILDFGVYFKLGKKSSSKPTWFFFEFELDFYCLCSLQKSISKSNWFFSFLNLIFWNWKKFEWHSISQKSSGDRQGERMPIWSLGCYPQHCTNVFNVRIQADIWSDIEMGDTFLPNTNVVILVSQMLSVACKIKSCQSAIGPSHILKTSVWRPKNKINILFVYLFWFKLYFLIFWLSENTLCFEICTMEKVSKLAKE